MKKLSIIIGVCLVALSSLFYVYKKAPRSLIMPNLSYELPKGVDGTYTEDIRSLGLTNVKNVNNLIYIKQRIHWKSTHNLKFMGDEEMTKFLADNNFVMAPSANYIGDIPDEAGVTLINNYKKMYPKVNNYRLWSFSMHQQHTYFLNDNHLLNPVNNSAENVDLTKVLKKSVIDSLDLPLDKLYGWMIRNEQIETPEIQIIGGRKYFNLEGLVDEGGIFSKPPPIDPIAVVKVEHGYVELANWE